ncbi:hypothetical protein [Magnetospirillum moscoviense]|uniref:Uncharacterized protein n=1 Tax=Magnetospirillum moscoviense TaxID=1437059 RepID=A0A178MXK1_9PROT|nr:hypothetical protein [Magnetospirillum moscoviense]MBF0324701.1 hypothetical protein [Alphaproteobacteria bacterium]OAN54249.1 hypothetical protein A6A05_08750 [Magnetospirillum moscoviense]
MLKADKIVSAVLAGVVEARHTYAAWTANGGYFSWAPEYLITVSVAQAVWDWCAPLTVWPEFPLGDAARDSAPAGPGAPGRAWLDGNRRVDLLIYRGGSRPHAVVEIKRNVDGWGRISGDLDRMRSLLAGEGGSFQLGVVAFSCTYMAPAEPRERERFVSRLRRMAEAAEAVDEPGWRCRLTAGGINHDGHEYWSAAAVVMERADPERRRSPGKARYSPCESRSAQVTSPP